MSSKRKDILKNETGMALVIALLMMIVLTLIGLASVFTSSFELRLAGNKRGSTDAFYAADTGVHVSMANVNNFALGKYVDNKFNPFTVTDPNSLDYNPNPTKAKVVIEHRENEQGAPRGLGMSAVQVGYVHYLIQSTGYDQSDLSPLKSTCEIDEKVLRIVPTAQGGY